jgi:hypothetical protein
VRDEAPFTVRWPRERKDGRGSRWRQTKYFPPGGPRGTSSPSAPRSRPHAARSSRPDELNLGRRRDPSFAGQRRLRAAETRVWDPRSPRPPHLADQQLLQLDRSRPDPAGSLPARVDAYSFADRRYPRLQTLPAAGRKRCCHVDSRGGSCRTPPFWFATATLNHSASLLSHTTPPCQSSWIWDSGSVRLCSTETSQWAQFSRACCQFRFARSYPLEGRTQTVPAVRDDASAIGKEIAVSNLMRTASSRRITSNCSPPHALHLRAVGQDDVRVFNPNAAAGPKKGKSARSRRGSISLIGLIRKEILDDQAGKAEQPDPNVHPFPRCGP